MTKEGFCEWDSNRNHLFEPEDGEAIAGKGNTVGETCFDRIGPATANGPGFGAL